MAGSPGKPLRSARAARSTSSGASAFSRGRSSTRATRSSRWSRTTPPSSRRKRRAGAGGAPRGGVPHGGTAPATLRPWRAARPGTRSPRRRSSPLRLLRARDSGARSRVLHRGRASHPDRPAVRSLSPHSSGRRARGAVSFERAMSDAAPGREAAPAALAAIFLLCGILLGARSVTGTGRAIALACGCALLLAVAARRRERGPVALLASTLFWASLGFLEARSRIREPAEEARRAFRTLPSQRERADRVEGVLTDFWSGSPPRVRGRMRAERVWTKGAWHPFPADIFIFLSGETPAEGTADRGDRVDGGGQ